MHPRAHVPSGHRRRGAITVFVAISLVIIIGMAALAVDIGALYSAQAELQRTADAAALAAAGRLVRSDDPSYQQDVIQVAGEVAERNSVMRHAAGLDSDGDVEFGRAVYDASTERYSFSPGGDAPDAVRVTVRRAEGSAGGPITLAFSRMMGQPTRSLQARAAAMLIPRDMAVVIDLSGSMAYDSTLRFWNRSDGSYANTRDCWAALNGPEPARPYNATVETESQYASDTGPTFGAMTNWGTPLIPGVYDVTSDPGLWLIRSGQNQSLSAITSSLTARGYTSDERTILMSGARDASSGAGLAHFRNRCGVMLGLASWRSGRTGGQPGGDGDMYVEDGEVTWIAYPSWRGSWTWQEWIDFMQTSSYKENDAAVFRYRYGLKTLTHWLLRVQRQINVTTNLWATPQEPLRAVKDAVQTLVDTLIEQDNLDRLSLEIFGTTARHEVNLSGELQTVADRLYAMQAGHYDVQTNMGGGLQAAIAELRSSRARPNAHKVIIFMSDGVANVDSSGNTVANGAASAESYALGQAQQARNYGFQIHTVSVGFEVDRAIMQEIAAIGGGQEFFAGGNPEQYTEQLQDIFRRLGGKKTVRLIE